MQCATIGIGYIDREFLCTDDVQRISFHGLAGFAVAPHIRCAARRCIQRYGFALAHRRQAGNFAGMFRYYGKGVRFGNRTTGSRRYCYRYFGVVVGRRKRQSGFAVAQRTGGFAPRVCTATCGATDRYRYFVAGTNFVFVARNCERRYGVDRNGLRSRCRATVYIGYGKCVSGGLGGFNCDCGFGAQIFRAIAPLGDGAIV